MSASPSPAPYTSYTTTSFSYPNLRLVYIYGAPTIFEQLIATHKAYVSAMSDLSTNMSQVLGGDLADEQYTNYTDASAWIGLLTTTVSAAATETQQLSALRNQFLVPSVYSSAETYADSTFWTTYYSATSTSSPSTALGLTDLVHYIAAQIQTNITDYAAGITDGWFLYHIADYEAVIACVSEMVKSFTAAQKVWKNMDNSLANFSQADFCVRIALSGIDSQFTTILGHFASLITDLIAVKILIHTAGNSALGTDILAETNASLVGIQALFATLDTDLTNLDVAVKAIYNPANTYGLLNPRATAVPSI